MDYCEYWFKTERDIRIQTARGVLFATGWRKLQSVLDSVVDSGRRSTQDYDWIQQQASAICLQEARKASSRKESKPSASLP